MLSHHVQLWFILVTPIEFFYKRNHGPIPIVDDIERYSVSVTGLIAKPKGLFMKDVWKLLKYNVAATLQCAGNRTAMRKTRTVKGVGWDVATIGNAVWGGAKLADVLELVGIPKLTSTTPSGGKHVEFVINVSALVYLLLYYLLCKHSSLAAQLKGLHSMLGDLVCWKFHIFT